MRDVTSENVSKTTDIVEKDFPTLFRYFYIVNVICYCLQHILNIPPLIHKY